jgi:glycyl-tRNA synthetase beta subunit
MREHEIAVNKLNEWRKRMDEKLTAALQKIKDFAGKSSMSETEKYVAELMDLDKQIEEFREEVCATFS